jgi:hypothetical protein
MVCLCLVLLDSVSSEVALLRPFTPLKLCGVDPLMWSLFDGPWKLQQLSCLDVSDSLDYVIGEKLVEV